MLESEMQHEASTWTLDSNPDWAMILAAMILVCYLTILLGVGSGFVGSKAYIVGCILFKKKKL